MSTEFEKLAEFAKDNFGCTVTKTGKTEHDTFENLFGAQSGYTDDERETYRKMLEQDSVEVGINISDLF